MVQGGATLRAAALRFGVGKSTAFRWVKRAGSLPLTQVDFSNRPCCPQKTTRIQTVLEERIVDLRRELQERSALGEYGAQAIRRSLLESGLSNPPSVRTIGRVLERRGVLDGRRRRRYPAPPTGWYLPPLSRSEAELDSFDLVEDLRIENGPLVDVLNAISLHSRMAQAWPVLAQATAKFTVQCLVEHWRQEGLPRYAQFDNDTRFQGAHHRQDAISRVMRLCLSLGVTPVFTPPRETGFQANIEAFNRRWQDVVWSRFHHLSLDDLMTASWRFIQAHRNRHLARREAAPLRRPFPQNFELDLQARLTGTIVYLRRTDADGNTALLGHTFQVDSQWQGRLVRCELDLDCQSLTFFALRRCEPTVQPVLREIQHIVPNRRFRE